MLPDQVSNPGPLTYESGALPIALRGRAQMAEMLPLVRYSFTLSFPILFFFFFSDLGRYTRV